MELRGCKTEQIEEATRHVLDLFSSEQNKVSAGQLELIRKQFAKMRIELPPEVE